jgi:hypothetical protein
MNLMKGAQATPLKRRLRSLILNVKGIAMITVSIITIIMSIIMKINSIIMTITNTSTSTYTHKPAAIRKF